MEGVSRIAITAVSVGFETIENCPLARSIRRRISPSQICVFRGATGPCDTGRITGVLCALGELRVNPRNRKIGTEALVDCAKHQIKSLNENRKIDNNEVLLLADQRLIIGNVITIMHLGPVDTECGDQARNRRIRIADKNQSRKTFANRTQDLRRAMRMTFEHQPAISLRIQQCAFGK